MLGLFPQLSPLSGLEDMNLFNAFHTYCLSCFLESYQFLFDQQLAPAAGILVLTLGVKDIFTKLLDLSNGVMVRRTEVSDGPRVVFSF